MPDPTGPVEAERAARLRVISQLCCCQDHAFLGVDEVIEAGRAEFYRDLDAFRSAVRRAFAAEVREDFTLYAEHQPGCAHRLAIENRFSTPSAIAQTPCTCGLAAALARLGEGA